MAVAVLAELAARGRRVPDDVAVFGYDDLGIAETTTPPLSTVVNPVEAMAARAGEMLVEVLEGRDPARAVVVPGELVLRGSA